MKFGASIASYTTSWDSIESAVQTMDRGTFDSVWFPDHFIPPSAWKGAEDQPIFESWSLLAAVASSTSKLRMGHMVNGNTYRNPALVVKMATTIDQISRGRFILSHGAAWFEREHLAYGWGFPGLKERSDRFEESCHLIRSLLTSENPVDFNGTYYSLTQAPLSPGSFQKPHIPIMVGGMGEKRTLKTLAKYGDIWNLDGFAVGKYVTGITIVTCNSKNGPIGITANSFSSLSLSPPLVLWSPAKASKRHDTFLEAEKFIANVGPGTLAGSVEYVIQRISEFMEAGVDEIMFSPRPSTSESLQELDDLVMSAFN